MPDQLRVLIADDHPLYRKGLRNLLSSRTSIEVVGEAASGLEAVRLTEELQPHLVLMDLQMPGGGGLLSIRRLARRCPHIHILVVTMLEDDDSVFAALRAGARGYVLKDAEEEQMLHAVLAVGHGEAVFSSAIAAHIMRYFAAPPTGPVVPFPELTDSERNVLRHLARGLSNDAIAEHLSLSPKTVRNYVSSVFTKLHVGNRAQAAIAARDAGLD